MTRNVKIIKFIPQGYCKGVIKAIKKINTLLQNNDMPKPYYMYGKLVHNTHVTDAYESLGIKIINDYQNITKGTIIITAHGLSQLEKQNILSRGLAIVDTTCSEVLKIEQNIKKKIQEGFQILYYGKLNHPECKSIMSISDNIVLITSPKDIDFLKISDKDIYFTSQTTMSYVDLLEIVNILKSKYKNIIFDINICNASKTRQEAVMKKAGECDIVIIVGDKSSNNTNKLKELCETKCLKKCYLIENIEDLEAITFEDNMTIGITAGASTPNKLVDNIINKIINPNCNIETTNLDYIKI